MDLMRTIKVISSQAMHVTAKAARGMEGSETSGRAKAVMPPRASRTQINLGGDIVRSLGNQGSNGKLVACLKLVNDFKYLPWMQLIYGVPTLYTPGKNVLFKNIGRSAGYVGQP